MAKHIKQPLHSKVFATQLNTQQTLNNMETQKLSIEIRFSEEDNVFIISSKEMRCHYPIKKDINLLKNEISDLIEEWIDIRAVL